MTLIVGIAVRDDCGDATSLPSSARSVLVQFHGC
jgi:hypothetical protein